MRHLTTVKAHDKENNTYHRGHDLWGG